MTAEGVLVLADKGYTGIGAGVTTPVRAVRRRPGTGLFERRDLSVNERAVNASQARLRARGERANAQLKTWRVLRRYHGLSPPPDHHHHSRLDAHHRRSEHQMKNAPGPRHSPVWLV
ncbi:transposase family protein (plasmid) [Arsenicicoccus dermatophilus]|uniref:transposase family protein n=1 Tax=Arsenicicoccus dermatophilus TaxID=1076331 RepID=UPI003892631E